MKTNQIIKKSALLICVFTVICGIIYPLVMTGISQLVFSKQANGSLIIEDNQVIGSKLIAQPILEQAYFIGRPDGEGVSNLAYKSEDLSRKVEERISWWNEFDPSTIGKQIPDDLIYASASGVDPDITVEAAMFQASRIADERGISVSEVEQLIKEHTQKPMFGFLGESCVNVLELNLALDK